MTTAGLLRDDDLARARDALAAAGFTSDGIAARLGPEITSAVARDDFRAALRATQDGDPLATLIRLFICGQTEPAEAVRAALGTVADPSPLLRRDAGGYAAGVDLEPYGQDAWIVSDLPSTVTGTLRPDHVLGAGGASTTLSTVTVRDPVERALDLGTGCGIQALHLSGHARRVTATDVSPRALRFAATTARLSGLDWDLRQGDMAAPVAGERFDLVVSNPPFVVGPGIATHTYRDSGRPGDAVCAQLAAAAPGLLNPGGTLQYLANWLHVAGEDWAERVAGWFAGSGLDVWVIQREVTDPLAYVRMWLADAAEAGDPHRAAAWLDWFDAHKVTGVGFGIVTAVAAGHADPVVRAETMRQPIVVPFGPEVRAWFARQDWLHARSTQDLLDSRYATPDGLTLRQDAVKGASGWEVGTQTLIQEEGLGWAEEIDPALLALVGGADGTLTLRDQLDLLAASWGEQPSTLYATAAVLVPHLVERGFLLPVPGPASGPRA